MVLLSLLIEIGIVMKFDKIIKSAFCAALLCGSLFGASHGTHWGYTGHDGAQNWGNLAPEYSTCKDGKNQSPINIFSNCLLWIQV